MGLKKSVLRHSRELFHFMFTDFCVAFTHFLCSLSSASVSLKSQALSRFF